jgi:hypothetical protein
LITRFDDSLCGVGDDAPPRGDTSARSAGDGESLPLALSPLRRDDAFFATASFSGVFVPPPPLLLRRDSIGVVGSGGRDVGLGGLLDGTAGFDGGAVLGKRPLLVALTLALLSDSVPSSGLVEDDDELSCGCGCCCCCCGGGGVCVGVAARTSEVELSAATAPTSATVATAEAEADERPASMATA